MLGPILRLEIGATPSHTCQLTSPSSELECDALLTIVDCDAACALLQTALLKVLPAGLRAGAKLMGPSVVDQREGSRST